MAQKDDTAKAISRFSVPAMEELPKDIKKIFTGAEKRMGFVPNII